MTSTQENTHQAVAPSQQSLVLIADRPELLRVRVLPAEFARMLGVSKQSVSRWIRDGKVTVNPLDGRLEVQSAIQQVLRSTDPGKMRARILRQAVEDVQDLRANLADAEDRADQAVQRASIAIERAERLKAECKNLRAYLDETDCLLETLYAGFVRLPLEARALPDENDWLTAVRSVFERADKACAAVSTAPPVASSSGFDLENAEAVDAWMHETMPEVMALIDMPDSDLAALLDDARPRAAGGGGGARHQPTGKEYS